MSCSSNGMCISSIVVLSIFVVVIILMFVIPSTREWYSKRCIDNMVAKDRYGNIREYNVTDYKKYHSKKEYNVRSYKNIDNVKDTNIDLGDENSIGFKDFDYLNIYESQDFYQNNPNIYPQPLTYTTSRFQILRGER